MTPSPPQRSETNDPTPNASEIDRAPSPAPDPESSRLERLRELLEIESGETPEKGDAGETPQNAEPHRGAPKGKPKTLKDLAERLSVSDSDLYSVEIPIANGKPVTLGALKDAHAKQDAHTVRELAFEERVSSQEAEWTRAQREFQLLVASLDPKTIKPEVREKIAQQMAADAKRERELTLQAIPDWADATKRDAELSGMVELLKDYGMSEQFLIGNPNHKLFRFVRDAFLRKQRMTAALAKVTEIKKPSTTGRGAPGGAARKPADRETTPRTSTLRARVLDVLQ